MSKTDYRCDVCGTPLFLDAGGKSATCPACGNREVYIFDLLENEDKVFPVQASKSINEYIAKGEAFLEMKEYTDAFENFAKAINADPNDHRGWWGTCRCRMLNNYLGEDNGYSKDFKKVQILASKAIRQELEVKYETYLEVLNKKREEKERELDMAKRVAMGEISNVKASSSLKKRSFTWDIVIIVIIFSLCPFLFLLGYYNREKYLIFSIVFGLMLIVGGVFLILRIIELKKMIFLIESQKVKTVTELMAFNKKKKREYILKSVQELISTDRLIGFSLREGEYLEKTEE